MGSSLFRLSSSVLFKKTCPPSPPHEPVLIRRSCGILGEKLCESDRLIRPHRSISHHLCIAADVLQARDGALGVVEDPKNSSEYTETSRSK